MFTEEESREMRGNLDREYLGMSLDEFTQAEKASKFDDDQERHGDATFLAMMLPECWTDLGRNLKVRYCHHWGKSQPRASSQDP